MKRILMPVFILFFVLSCQPQNEAETVFRIGNGADPGSIDPAINDGVPESRIISALFEGLVVQNPDGGAPLPGMAESWEISNNGTTYTFTLREGIAWSDGVAITAQTFVDSWLRILNPDLGSAYAWFPALFVKGGLAYNSGEADKDAVHVRALSDRIFEFDLVGPAPYALEALYHHSFFPVPLHAIEEYGESWTQVDNIVSNGPFVLKSWVPQASLTVEKNESYWDKDAVKLDEVVFLPIENARTALNAYNNDEVDWITTIPNDSFDELRLRDDFHVNTVLTTYYYAFNTDVVPLDDVRVRQALSLAINRKDIVEFVTGGGETPAYAMSPSMPGYETLKDNFEDVELAKKLLADAGYPNGEGFPDFELIYNSSESHRQIAESVQQQWKENLNIDITLVNQEWKTYQVTRNTSNFQIIRAGWGSDYADPNTFLDLFTKNSFKNYPNYKNPRYTEIIEEAALLPNGEERYALLREADKLISQEDFAVMPIYYNVAKNLIDTEKWGGWSTTARDEHPIKTIYLK